MKKFLFIGLFLFIAGNVLFGQVPLTKEQEKQVKHIQKQVQREIDNTIESTSLLTEEKKNRIFAAREKRDAQLVSLMTWEQASVIKAKDPIKWEKAINKVEKMESAKLKVEFNEKRENLNKREKDLNDRKNAIKAQMNALKKEQDDISLQQKALKQERKSVKAQYQ